MLDPIKTFISLLALVDPLAALPTFIALTASFTMLEKQRVARVTALAIPLIITVAAFFGAQIIATMGISLGAFKIGGGIVLLLMGIQMMSGTAGIRSSPEQTALEAAHKHSIAVVPLALPVLVGPGTISTVIIYSAKSKGIADLAVIVGSGVLIGFITWLLFRAAPRIAQALGVTGINIATKVMGLLLTSLAAEFMVDGLIMMIPALQK